MSDLPVKARDGCHHTLASMHGACNYGSCPHCLDIENAKLRDRVRELEAVLQGEPSFAAVMERAVAAENAWKTSKRCVELVEAERDELRKRLEAALAAEEHYRKKLEAAEKARDEAQAACATMREALVLWRNYSVWQDDDNYDHATKLADAALASNAGKDILRRLEAAEKCAELLDIYRGCVPDKCRKAVEEWKATK